MNVFISYSHLDKQSATIVLNILEKNGIRCWIDYRDALPGMNYAGSIVKAIKESRFFVLVLSKASSVSQHVLNEINTAVNAEKIIIPFRLDDVEFTDSLEYYLGKSHWLDAIAPPIEKHVEELVSVLNHYTDKSNDVAPNEPKVMDRPKNIQQCQMKTFEEMLELGYTATTIAIQLVENDYVNCNGIGMENEGTAKQWEEYLQNNSETFQYLINQQNKIVGDWSIVALNDKAYDEAIQGKLLEKDIGVDVTEMICFPGVYNGYLLTISLLPGYRSMNNYNLIIDSFFKQLEIFSENGIFFRRWCINVFGKEVEAIVRSLGFSYVCDNVVYGKIYSLEFMPLPKIALLKKYPNLIKNYENAEY